MSQPAEDVGMKSPLEMSDEELMNLDPSTLDQFDEPKPADATGGEAPEVAEAGEAEEDVTFREVLQLDLAGALEVLLQRRQIGARLSQLCSCFLEIGREVAVAVQRGERHDERDHKQHPERANDPPEVSLDDLVHVCVLSLFSRRNITFVVT